MLDGETGILDPVLASQPFQIALPALAVGRVGEHEVEFAGGEGVVGEGRVLRAADDVVGRLALALEQEVGLGDGVGLGVDLLAVEVGGDLLAVLGCQVLQGLLRDRQHAAGSAGAVVEQIGAGLDRVGDGRKIRLAMSRTASRGVQCSPASSLFSSLKRRTSSSKIVPIAWLSRPGRLDRAVAVLDRVGAEVDRRVEELLDQSAEGVGSGQPRDLVAELEICRGCPARWVRSRRGRPRSRLRSCCCWLADRRSRRVKGEVL